MQGRGGEGFSQAGVSCAVRPLESKLKGSRQDGAQGVYINEDGNIIPKDGDEHAAEMRSIDLDEEVEMAAAKEEMEAEGIRAVVDNNPSPTDRSEWCFPFVFRPLRTQHHPPVS